MDEFDIHSIGDSHLQNIKKMKKAGINHPFMLLRAPMKSQIEDTIRFVDISLNSEISILQRLNKSAKQQNKIHKVVLMVELGDKREGILPDDLDKVTRNVIKLTNIDLIGIGTNLGCLNGVIPDNEKMSELAHIADKISENHQIPLKIISGGNSSNYQWLNHINKSNIINHLRIGEAILLGIDPISTSPIPGLENDTFKLQVEVIESKRKNSQPIGSLGNNTFGDKPQLFTSKPINRAILAIGIQDVDPKGCVPVNDDIKIYGATSDHMIVTNKHRLFKVGNIVEFRLRYKALLRLMISPYVNKEYIY